MNHFAVHDYQPNNLGRQHKHKEGKNSVKHFSVNYSLTSVMNSAKMPSRKVLLGLGVSK